MSIGRLYEHAIPGLIKDFLLYIWFSFHNSISPCVLLSKSLTKSSFEAATEKKT